MSTLNEMAKEYRVAAAKLALSIDRHKKANDLTSEELTRLASTLKDMREQSKILSGYYDFPRPQSAYTLIGLKVRHKRDDN